MILLTYLKTQIRDDQFYNQLVQNVSLLDSSKNFIIAPSQSHVTEIFSSAANRDNFNPDQFMTMSCFQEKHHIRPYKRARFEDLAGRNLRNIILLDFDDIDIDYVESLIRIKSKNTNILGISNRFNLYFKDMQLSVQECKKLGYDSEQLSIMLMLKYNSSDMVNDVVSRYDSIYKKSNIKEVDNVSELFRYIKT